jgi:DNA-binding winged helix-turn-helix (wHTH) protein/tetratricopeptide (TPR) repeat protein
MPLQHDSLYYFDEFSLDRSRRTLERGHEPVPVSSKAFEVLSYLVMNPGRVVPKEELLQAVWAGSFVEEGNLTQQISGLRKVLGDRSGYIVTVPGKGYQFTARVRSETLGGGIVQQPVPEFVVHTLRERTRIVVENNSEETGIDQCALPAPEGSKGWIWLAVPVLLLAAGAGWYALHRGMPHHHEIVVADFDNRTGDEVFDFLLKNALEIDLEQSPELSIVSAPQTRNTLLAMGLSPDDRVTPSLAREICERNAAQAFLSGSIVKLDRSYVVTLEATDCVSGKRIASLRTQAPNRDSTLESLGTIDSKMRRKLGESLHSIQGFDVPIQQATTVSFEALVAYSRGVQNASKGLIAGESIPFMERAIQLDQNFAMAYEALGVAHANLGDLEAAKTAFARAYELRRPTSAREQFLITSRFYEVAEGDLEGAAKNLQLWTESYPLDGLVWGGLANTYTQMALYPEAIEAGKRAVELEPDSALGYVVLARAYKRMSQFALAKAVCSAAHTRGLDSWHLHSVLYQIAVAEQDTTSMARESGWDKGRPSHFQTLDNTALGAATEGRLAEAEQLFHEAAGDQGNDSKYADEVNADMAEAQRLLGATDAARITAGKVPKNADGVAFQAGLSAALSGNTAYSRKVVEELNKAPASSSLTWKVYLPILTAGIALEEHKPAQAIEDLQPARPYRLRDYYFNSLLGEAFLKNHQPDQAAGQFRETIANPGIDPLSPMYPLAHLGLARSLAMAGDASGSRNEYEALFALWKNADPDLPILKQAHLEYSSIH